MRTSCNVSFQKAPCNLEQPLAVLARMWAVASFSPMKRLNKLSFCTTRTGLQVATRHTEPETVPVRKEMP